MPILSIIIPIYQAKNTLKRCVNSILSQSYSDFEVILVNDGSTDGSKTICEQLSLIDSRIKVFNKENGGVSDARNLGIEQACGEWITFIDSDDYIQDGYLDSLMQSVNPNTLTLVGFTKVDENDNIISLNKYSERCLNMNDINIIFSEFNILSKGYAVGKLYNKAKLIKHNIRFVKDMAYSEDLVFMLEYMLYIENVMSLQTTGYHYVEMANSLSKKIYSFNNEYQTICQILSLCKLNCNQYNVQLPSSVYSYISKNIMRCIIATKGNFHQLLSLKTEFGVIVKQFYSTEIKLMRLYKYLFLNQTWLLSRLLKFQA